MTAETIPTSNTPEMDPLDANTPYDLEEASPLYDELNAEGTASASIEMSDASNSSEYPITATSRVGRVLQRMSDRIENDADRADSVAERYQDTKEAAKVKLQGIGRSALIRLKSAGRIATALPIVALEAGSNGVKRANEAISDAAMNGFEKVEAGMDTVGTKIVDTKANVKANYQTFRFNRETKSNQKQFQKEYAQEMKAFDKKAKSEAKLQAKVDKWESKFAAKEDRRFERSMRKKAAEERRAERRTRWASRLASVKEAIVATPDMMGDAIMTGFGKLENGMDKVGAAMINGKEAATDKIEHSKASVQATRAAGRAALEAFKTTRQTHTEQNKLY